MSDPQKTSGHFLMNPYILVTYLIVTFVVLTNTKDWVGNKYSISHTYQKQNKKKMKVLFSFQHRILHYFEIVYYNKQVINMIQGILKQRMDLSKQLLAYWELCECFFFFIIYLYIFFIFFLNYQIIEVQRIQSKFLLTVGRSDQVTPVKVLLLLKNL